MSAHNFSSIVIYDDETTGLDRDYDQVLESAMIRLDGNYEVIDGSEQVLSVRPRVDVPPHPKACLTHRLNLAELRETGMSEYDYAREFQAYLSRPGTLIGGFNNLQYDDEMTRRLNFRNLRDPYGHEWRDGNRRFDVLNIVRTLYAWDPDTLRWPVGEDGEVSMKLEALSRANNIELENAHDAMSDVKATADLLHLIHAIGTPWLDRCLAMTDKRAVERLVAKRQPLFHISPHYSKARCYSSMILPIVRDSQSSNKVLCVDLAKDPTDLLAMKPEDIRRYLFTPRSELEENPPTVAISTIQINKQPSLAEISDVPASLHGRMGVDLSTCLKRAKMVMADKDFARRLREAYEVDFPEPADVYSTLYSGAFFNPADTSRRDQAHHRKNGGAPRIATEPASDIVKGAHDTRLTELAIRLQGINFPHALTKPEDHDRFLSYLDSRLHDPQTPGMTVAEAREEIDMARFDLALDEGSPEEAVLKDLEKHLAWIEGEALRLRTRPMSLSSESDPVLEQPKIKLDKPAASTKKRPEKSGSSSGRSVVCPF